MQSGKLSLGDRSKQDNECDLRGLPGLLLISDLQSECTDYPSESGTLSTETQTCKVLYHPNVVVIMKRRMQEL